VRFLEAHAERMVGRKVHDANGEVVGRLEEMIVEVVDGEYVVTEFHVGPAALLERIGCFFEQVPYFRLLPFPRWAYHVGWRDVDLADPNRPRLRIAKSALVRTQT
jgi:sporulation protein YlmC with PRC-barrel domain